MRRRIPSRTRRALIGAICASLAAAPASAEPPAGKGKPEKAEKHGGKGKPGKEGHSGAGAASLSAGITVSQARGIAIELGTVGYPPLPPGIRKNLARGKPLPPGIAKKLAPQPLIARLPAHPGHEWRVVGTDLVLVAIATAVVVDILIDVLR